MRIILLSVYLVFVSTGAYALPDTQENRTKEADRYLKASPPEDVFNDMTEKVALQMPENQREAFKSLLMKNMDLQLLIQAMRSSMIKHFTADELSALADFYGSDVGRSAMGKLGVYMADVMPVMQTELIKAIQKSNSQITAPK